jgi:hypothetical protein
VELRGPVGADDYNWARVCSLIRLVCVTTFEISFLRAIYTLFSHLWLFYELKYDEIAGGDGYF